MQTSLMLRFFDKYVNLGLRPIALHPGSKRPVEPEWSLRWSVDRWRGYFLAGGHNMGLLLGDIIDVEGDTEEANDLLERMIDGRPRPMYRSSKSVHNLFVNPDPNLTRLVVNGIEFRGWSHMSVVPPSEHSDGLTYKWLAGSSFPIPEMPDELAAFYFRNRRCEPSATKRHSRAKGRGRNKTHCNKCEKMFPIHITRLRLEVQAFAKHGLRWMCRRCRPMDIRQACREVRRLR